MESTSFSSLNSSTTLPSRSGFTLIEMLVVLSLITVFSIAILSGQSTYNQTLVLNNTAYEIAFDLRQAQSYGLSNRSLSPSVTKIAYGINFNRSTPTQYTFYADGFRAGTIPSLCTVGISTDPDFKPGDCLYTVGNDTVLNTTRLTRGFTIGRFCGLSTGSTIYCSANPQDATLASLNVVFIRPNTKTIMTGIQSGTQLQIQMKCVQIRLDSPTRGTSKTIRVTQFGEISLNQTCPGISP